MWTSSPKHDKHLLPLCPEVSDGDDNVYDGALQWLVYTPSSLLEYTSSLRKGKVSYIYIFFLSNTAFDRQKCHSVNAIYS